MLDIPFTALEAGVTAPIYANPGDAGADLVATRDVVLEPAGGRALVPTGLAGSRFRRVTPDWCSLAVGSPFATA